MELVFRDCCDCCAYPFEDGEKPVPVDNKKVHDRCEERFQAERAKPIDPEQTAVSHAA